MVSLPYQPRLSPPNVQVATQPWSVPTQTSPPTASTTGFPYRSLSWTARPSATSLAADALLVVAGGG